MTDSPEREQPVDADKVSTEETPVTDLPTAENEAPHESPVGDDATASENDAASAAYAMPAEGARPAEGSHSAGDAPQPGAYAYATGPVTEALATSAPSTGAVPVAQPAHAAPRPSVLGRVRENRSGPVAVTVGVGLVVALLLAVLVPSSPNLYASVVLGLLVTAAVGFTARNLAGDRGWEGILTAFVSAVLAVHVLAVTGTVDGAGPGEILEQLGAQGPGFDDAILAALATPPVSTGGLLAGLIAGIITGWGGRERD